MTFVSEADEALRLADHLFDLQNYDESVTEYKRFIFFNPEDKRVGDAFYKIGLAYRAERNWAEAIDALRMSIQKADSDKAKDERRIELGITLIASGNYNLAQLELLTVSEVSQYDSMRRKALYFQGVTDLYMFNWEDAQKRFNLFYSTFERQQRLDIDSLLVEARHLPSKSVRIAKILSTILPGAGQIYAGHWKNGLNALALNSLLATVCLNSIRKGHYRDSVIFFPLFQRYHLGNRYNAAEYVKQYNQNLNRQYAAKILRVLLEN